MQIVSTMVEKLFYNKFNFLLSALVFLSYQINYDYNLHCFVYFGFDFMNWSVNLRDLGFLTKENKSAFFYGKGGST